MPTIRPDIRALAADFTATHPPLDPDRQRLALAAFRLLGEGRPFTDEELAERAGLRAIDLGSLLGPSMVHRDERGRVVAVGGLTLEPTSHSLQVDGRTLHAWCALDTLFLPELLGRPGQVRSTDPATGETIALAVDSAGVHDVAPAEAVMTLHEASGFDLDDVIGTFCCYVHFFASEEAAREWATRSAGTYVASLDEGFEYGRLYNHGRLGAALAGDRR